LRRLIKALMPEIWGLRTGEWNCKMSANQWFSGTLPQGVYLARNWQNAYLTVGHTGKMLRRNTSWMAQTQVPTGLRS
jgi:hypothetical protein